MLKNISSPLTNENGTALLIAMVILMVVTFIGVAANNTSTIENMISGNDRLQKVAFHAADGGTESGIELVEQNIEASGFNSSDTALISNIHVNTNQLKLYLNTTPSIDANGIATRVQKNIDVEGNTSSGPDAYFPKNASDSQPHTSLAIGGHAKLATGAAIQMLAGYEGKGKGSGSGGVHVFYDIWSQHKGAGKSRKTVRIQWRHVL